MSWFSCILFVRRSSQVAPRCQAASLFIGSQVCRRSLRANCVKARLVLLAASGDGCSHSYSPSRIGVARLTASDGNRTRGLAARRTGDTLCHGSASHMVWRAGSWRARRMLRRVASSRCRAARSLRRRPATACQRPVVDLPWREVRHRRSAPAELRSRQYMLPPRLQCRWPDGEPCRCVVVCAPGAGGDPYRTAGPFRYGAAVPSDRPSP